MDNPVAANILGTAGAVCWSIQLIPQIIKNYRLHSTKGLHHTMYLAWALAGIPLGVYNIAQKFNIALQVQPNILIFLSLVAWAQCQYYGEKRGWGYIAAAVTIAAAGIGGVEAALYFALREAARRGLRWPFILVAVMAAVLLVWGVARYYWEIYKGKSVQGISFLFVFTDASGDLVSILALVFETRIDVLGIVVYAAELGLWIGIGALGVYFRLWPWVWRRICKKNDETEEGVEAVCEA